MTYSVVSNTNPSVVSCELSGSTLVLHYLAGGTASVTVKVVDSTGFGVQSVLNMTVVPKPGVQVGPIILNPQSGLYEQTVVVTNTSPVLDAVGVTLVVSNLTDGVTLYNSSGVDENGTPEIFWRGRLLALGDMSFVLQYYSPLRGVVPAADIYVSLSMEALMKDVQGTPVYVSDARFLLDGTYLLDFAAVPGELYYIQYTASLRKEWTTVYPGVKASANRVQWIDNGPPFTDSKPKSTKTRFYRVLKAAE
jgi:hypothetical protein